MARENAIDVVADELGQAAVLRANGDEHDAFFRALRVKAFREMAAKGWSYAAVLADEAEGAFNRADCAERKSIGSHLRAAIFARDGRLCGLCGRTDGRFEIDHKIPVSRGGPDTRENLWVTCSDCNRAKGTLTVEEYLDLLGDLRS